MTNRTKIDTGAARLPALPRFSSDDKALTNWTQAVTEYLEVRAGSRGNENERAVTLRELRELAGPVQNLTKILTADKDAGDGELKIDLGGGLSATVAIERFARTIIESRLFQSLAKTLDDPTRFDDLAKEIRDELLRSITDEAARRGAEIRDLQTVVQNNERSVAMAIREVTASLQQASAGLRATQAVFSDGQRAMATNVLQLQASLGNYYQDGTPGRASLEQAMTTVAGYTEGLRAQYTLKVQAGGALAGFGIAAEEVNGQTASAFIVSADKFAIVTPSYSGGLMRTPRPEDVVFGVDANGIYLQNNVYVKGNMRVDGTGRKIEDGMRGSVLLSASGSSWSDVTARQAIWQALGKSGSAPSNLHLQVGDAVTITNGSSFTQTRHWMGAAWTVPAAVYNGDLLVDGSVAARKVDTRGLTVRDNWGNVILDANGLDAQWLRNLHASQVSGLGTMATQSSARIGSTVTLPDGSVLKTTDFINRLQRITSNNISVFMDTAAIGTAYIGQAAVGTLQVAGSAVTAMAYGEGSAYYPSGSSDPCRCYLSMVEGSTGVVVSGTVNMVNSDTANWVGVSVQLLANGRVIAQTYASLIRHQVSSASISGFDPQPQAGTNTYTLRLVTDPSYPGSVNASRCSITAVGGKR